jgi:uncharacterized cupin superfamily protein
MSSNLVVRRWGAVVGEPLSEAAIVARYPAAKYRVATYIYPAGTTVSGVTRPATCHVLSGAGRYAFADVAATVRGGDVVELPAGDYSLQVLGDDQFVIVLCWELPFEVNRVQ